MIRYRFVLFSCLIYYSWYVGGVGGVGDVFVCGRTSPTINISSMLIMLENVRNSQGFTYGMMHEHPRVIQWMLDLSAWWCD